MRKTKVMTKLKSNKAITLIALVITIIVLLILAGVAISMLSGENGILKQAANAKTSTDVAKLSESIKLAATTVMTSTEHKLTEEEFKTELEKDGYKVNEDGTVTEGNVKYALTNKGAVKATIEDLKKAESAVFANTILEDENGHTITIPMNFNISSESPTLVTQGMIIEDSEENQYVWIPVFTSEQYDWGAVYPDTLPAKTADKSEFTTDHITAIKTALRGDDSAGYTKNYYDSNYSDVWYGDANYGKYGYYDGTKFNYYTNGNIKDSMTYNTLYNNMLISVYKNAGFYIGRYEMGIAVVNSTTEAQNKFRTSMTEYIPSKATNTSTEIEGNGATSIKGMTAPISKANAVGYTYITQPQAQMLAEKLGEKSDYCNVKSSIMFGLQWDIVCVFIENLDKNNTAETKSDWLTKSDYGKLWGNYEKATYTMNRGFYNLYNSDFTGWKNASSKTSASKSWLCTTGAVDKNSSLNIYDFGGNLSECTLERSSNPYGPCTLRGFSFNRGFGADGRETASLGMSYYRDCARTSFFII